MSADNKPAQRRGITHAYQSDRGQGGNAPSFYKRCDTLWQSWDKAMSDRNNTGARKYREKATQGQAIDKEVHRTPVSRMEINRLKAERARARAQPELTPNGPMGTRAQSVAEATRERKIHFQEKRLVSHKDKAREDFRHDQTLKAAVSLRDDLLKERAALKAHDRSRKQAEASGSMRDLTRTEREVDKLERRARDRVRSFERAHSRF